MDLQPTTRITEEIIEFLGFTFEDWGDDSPYEVWYKHNICIWNMNDEYWVIHMLDQAGIDQEFHTLADLEAFFQGCKLTIYD